MQVLNSSDEARTQRRETEPLSSPVIYFWSMVVFLALAGFAAAILGRQVFAAFSANPGLNGLIIGVAVVGVLLAFGQILRLRREVRWVNAFREGPTQAAAVKPPVLLSPMAGLIGNRRQGFALSPSSTRTMLDSMATRLDESRDIARYLIGLLVFLGLLGTFWGLLGTIGAITATIQSLDPGTTDAASVLSSVQEGLTAPLAGMGTAFSSSLFGLTGSMLVGFLDLQVGRAQNTFYVEVEDWLASVTDVGGDTPLGSSTMGGGSAGLDEMRLLTDKLNRIVEDQGTNPRTSAAMANLAESIQGLVQHMRSEQQMLRDFVEAQANEQRQMRTVLDRLSGVISRGKL